MRTHFRATKKNHVVVTFKLGYLDGQEVRVFWCPPKGGPVLELLSGGIERPVGVGLGADAPPLQCDGKVPLVEIIRREFLQMRRGERQMWRKFPLMRTVRGLSRTEAGRELMRKTMMTGDAMPITLMESLKLAGGAILRWQLPDEEAVKAVLDTGAVLFDEATDLVYLPGYDIEAERANVGRIGNTVICAGCRQEFPDRAMVEKLVIDGGELCITCSEYRRNQLMWWLELDQDEWETVPQSVREKLWVAHGIAKKDEAAAEATAEVRLQE